MIIFCVLKNGGYGEWSQSPFDYDAMFKDFDEAKDYAKNFECGVVHKFDDSKYDRWVCETGLYDRGIELAREKHDKRYPELRRILDKNRGKHDSAA